MSKSHYTGSRVTREELVPRSLILLPEAVRLVDIPRLARSIARDGLVEPLTVDVRDDGFLLRAGTRRLLAIEWLVDRGEAVRDYLTDRRRPAGEAYALVPCRVRR